MTNAVQLRQCKRVLCGQMTGHYVERAYVVKKRYDTLSEESKGIILSNTNLLWLIFLLLNNTERKKKVVKGKLAEEQKLGVRNLRKFSNTKT